MTSFPVVATPLNTRTVREVFDADEWMLVDDIDIELLTERGLVPGVTLDVRERLVADPAFVVLPEVPDLTCRTCDGTGLAWFTNAEGGYQVPHTKCPSCGGSGVSPVYAATWQWRHVYADGPLNWHALDDTCLDEVHAVADQRRQVVEWRARRVEPLPVIAGDEPPEFIAHILIDSDGERWLYREDASEDQADDPWRVTDEPWAADLQPGMCVLRLSDFERLPEPIVLDMPVGPGEIGTVEL